MFNKKTTTIFPQENHAMAKTIDGLAEKRVPDNKKVVTVQEVLVQNDSLPNLMPGLEEKRKHLRRAIYTCTKHRKVPQDKKNFMSTEYCWSKFISISA